MEFIYTFEHYLKKISEGLIITHDINKTTEDIKHHIDSLNIVYSIKIINNNTFELFIDELNKITHLDTKLDIILSYLFNLYGWFPSTMENVNFYGFTKKEKFIKDYLLNPGNSLVNTKIIFESKFDIVDNNIPKKLYHLTIQHYESDILKKGILPKSKFKLSNHDGRVYLCKNVDYCLSLIPSMKLFYSSEKDQILYSGKNTKRIYNKNTKWIIFEINTDIAEINKLYKDPNYLDGYYYINNINYNSINIYEKE